MLGHNKKNTQQLWLSGFFYDASIESRFEHVPIGFWKNNEVSRLSRQCFSVIEAGNEALADLIFLEVRESQVKTILLLDLL